jgi:hypothetical protein
MGNRLEKGNQAIIVSRPVRLDGVLLRMAFVVRAGTILLENAPRLRR